LELTADKPAVIQERYRLNCTIGKSVSSRDRDRTITGVADEVNDRGELLVRLSSGKIETVSAGDVALLKE
jgi:biotin-(acetyl-CoA carboxylase) ligase